MSTLQDYKRFLDQVSERVAGLQTGLDELLAHYQSFFAEIEQAREAELVQLRDHVRGGATLPDGFSEELRTAHELARQEVEAELARLARLRDDLLDEAELARSQSLGAASAVHEQNVELDAEEEALKRQAGDLLEQVESYNQRIRSLGSGAGFFLNFFKMLELKAHRDDLEARQELLAGRIEKLRQRWSAADTGFARDERERGEAWLSARTQAEAYQTKIDYLESARGRIQERTALTLALFERSPVLQSASSADPRCKRCGSPNPASYHFCHMCAVRLGEDEPDVGGSLAEIAELNLHHHRFSAGMKAVQELYGLLAGIRSGIVAFVKSVDDMIATQRRYSLAELQIEVPEEARRWTQVLDALDHALGLDQTRVHPVDLAARAEELVRDQLSQASIEGWFQTMGAELGAQADSQW